MMRESIRLLRVADAPHEMPWGGTHSSSQLMASQPAREPGAQSPLWSLHRVSVYEDGPWPLSPGRDCLLLAIEGGALVWHKTATGQESRLAPGSRLYFAGETRAALRAVQPPFHLLLLQLQRKRVHGCIDMRSRSQTLLMREGDTLLHCTRGACRVALPAHLGGERTLHAGDTLHIHLTYLPAFALPITFDEDQTRLVDLRISQMPGAA